MLATLASAAAAPPLAPPGTADAPTLDLYVGEERRTTLAATHATATEALTSFVSLGRLCCDSSRAFRHQRWTCDYVRLF